MLLEVFRKLLERKPQSHKYDFGHVLIIGGSAGMSGAAVLSAHAALRTGAGLVTLASHTVKNSAVSIWPEIMTPPTTSWSTIQQYIDARRVTTVVIGPGLQPSTSVRQRLQWLLSQPTLTVIIDGGALSVLHDHLALLDTARCQAVILTPHPGEFGRLIGEQLPATRAEQAALARDFATEHSAIIVYKGQPTYVYGREQEYENSTGNPGLATAGSGDVLSGIIAGVVAQGVAPFAAVQAAVYLHGLAGDTAAHILTQPSMNASDIIEAIPQAYSHIKANL